MAERIVGIVDEPEKSKNNDTLGIGRHATALTEYVRHCPTPMTIGIQGEWGSGKTSLLEQIKESLDAEGGKYLQIWVNAWEQSLLSTPEETLIKIIREVISKMTKGVSDTAKVEAIKQHASSLFKGAVRVGATMAAGNKAGQVVEEYFNQDSNIIQSLRKQLTDVSQGIRTRTTNPHEKIIIYVDDLDRVEPKDAVNVLELLKNIFNIPNCVFILAIDYQVVIKGLEHKFGKRTENNEWEFRAFFDKIIQLPFMMPMGQYNIGEYVSNLLGQIGFLSDNKPDTTNHIKDIITYSIGGNPRSLKRLVNSLALIQLFSQMGATGASEQGTNDKKDDLLLFALVCLQISFPLIYEQLARNPEFTSWDEDWAFQLTQRKEENQDGKFKEDIEIVQESEDFDEDWEKALYRVCYILPRYRARVTDISKLLNHLKNNLLGGLKEEELGERLSKVIDLTTVTSVNTSDAPQSNKPYQKRTFDDLDALIQEKRVKNQISDKSEPIFREVYSFLHLNLAEKYEFKLAPTYIALKLGSSNLCSIKISKSSVDMNFSRDKGLRFLKKQGLDIQTFPKVRGFRIIRIEDIHEFEQCREHILDYLRKCRG
jgi:hypothetical protein